MAARPLVARFVLTLHDRLSSGLFAIQRRLQALRQAAGRFGLGGGLAEQLQGLRQGTRQLALAGAAAAAVSFAGPVREAAAFEDALRQSAQTAGLTGAAVEERIAQQAAAYQRLAQQTGQSSMDIARTAGQMAAAGMNPELVQQFLPVLARVATATGAALTDLGSVGVRLNQNLRIDSPEELNRSFASMIQSARDGSVEMRDMARLFPALTAQVEALGVRGRPAVDMLGSLLQVAARGAATADVAGNNLQNFLSKLTSPETVRNFREMGVNLEAVMQDAARRGINPVHAVVQEIRTLSRGNMFRVGELFGDEQVLNFLRPMLGNTREYLTLLRGAAAAQTGLIDQSFEDRFRGMQVQLNLLMEQFVQLGRVIGMSVGRALPGWNAALEATLGGIERLEAAYPGLIGNVVQAIGGMLVLAGVLFILGRAVMPVVLALRVMWGAARLLLLPIRMLGALLMLLRVPLLAIAGLATALGVAFVVAGLHIYRHWDRFAPYFQQLWEGVQGIFRGFITFLTGVFLLDSGMAIAGLRQVWDGIKTAASALWEAVKQIFTDFGTWLDGWTGGALSAALALLERVATTMQNIRQSFSRGQEFQSPEAPALGEGQRRLGNRAQGLYPTPPAANDPAAAANDRRVQVGGEITVRLPPGFGAEITSSNPDVPITAGNRGATRNRP